MGRSKITKELTVTKPMELQVVGKSPADIICMAVQGKADLSKVKEFLDLQKEYEAEQARKAFAKSFAQAQAAIQPAIKKSTNPQTHSKYAKLEGVIEASQPIYTKSGFSVIFYEDDSPKADHVRICADVLHELGHQRTYHYDAPNETTGLKGNANMTATHGKASAVSYARRYLLCMIWNIPTVDDDGNKATSKMPDVTPAARPLPETSRAAATDAELKPENECWSCGAICNDAVKAFSLSKFKTILCRTCQAGAK